MQPALRALLAVLPLFAFTTVSAVRAAPAEKACQVAGYSHTSVKCKVVPAKGSFAIPIPGEKDMLKGKGSTVTKGTQLAVIRVPPPVAAKGGYGLRLRATGRFSPLHLTSGTLYRYDAAQNNLVGIRSISASGIYQVVH